jgi:hypothetical protein
VTRHKLLLRVRQGELLAQPTSARG